MPQTCAARCGLYFGLEFSGLAVKTVFFRLFYCCHLKSCDRSQLRVTVTAEFDSLSIERLSVLLVTQVLHQKRAALRHGR